MPLVAPDKDIVLALCRAMKPVAERTESVEVVAACASMIGALLVNNSEDLPQALGNVDRIADNLRTYLRKKMGN
jgi:hypothetical protein